MALFDGKQIKDATIEASKFALDVFLGLFRSDGTIPLSGPMDAGGNPIKNLAAPVDPNDAARLVDIGGGGVPVVVNYPSKANKSMVALATVADGDKATDTTLAATPAGDGYVAADVNGVGVSIGDGDKLSDIYLSADDGATALPIADFAAGATIHWVGSIAGYQLAPSDKLNLFYS